MVDHYVSVGTGLLFEEGSLRSREALGEAINVAQRVGFEVGVQVCFAEVSPDGVEHEAEDDCIGGPENSELPPDEIVVRGAPFAWPGPVENRHEEHGTRHRDDEDHYVLCESQHEGLSISEGGWSPSLSKFGSLALLFFSFLKPGGDRDGWCGRREFAYSVREQLGQIDTGFRMGERQKQIPFGDDNKNCKKQRQRRMQLQKKLQWQQ
jgi:hypothetical protein